MSLLALTQVNSKWESKLFDKIRLPSIIEMFNLRTLILVLSNLWKLSWTQRVCWHTHWQNYNRSFWLWLSIEPAFLPRADLSNWKILINNCYYFFFLLVEQYTCSGIILIWLKAVYNILLLSKKDVFKRKMQIKILFLVSFYKRKNCSCYSKLKMF